MLKFHQERRKVWSKKLRREQDQDDLSELENLQTDEIENVIPIKALPEPKVVKEEAHKVDEAPDSWRNESRCINPKFLTKVQVKKPTKQNVKKLAVTKTKEYDRNSMMKEVNDIINELQVMLKPKMYKFESEEKDNILDYDFPIPEKYTPNPYIDFAKDLTKTDFWSEALSLNSWKEDLDHSDDISLTNFDDSDERRVKFEDPKCFSQISQMTGILTDKLNKRSTNNIK